MAGQMGQECFRQQAVQTDEESFKVDLMGERNVLTDREKTGNTVTLRSSIGKLQN